MATKYEGEGRPGGNRGSSEASGGTIGYDSAIQMFIEKPRSLSGSTLGFMRWLAERGNWEHNVSGPSGGEAVNFPGSLRK